MQQLPANSPSLQQQMSFRQPQDTGRYAQGPQQASPPSMQHAPIYQAHTMGGSHSNHGLGPSHLNQATAPPQGYFSTNQAPTNSVQQQAPTSTLQQGYGVGSQPAFHSKPSQFPQQTQAIQQKSPRYSQQVPGFSSERPIEQGQMAAATAPPTPQPMDHGSDVTPVYQQVPGQNYGANPMGNPAVTNKTAVETVTEGDGVDARTKTTPKEEAEKRTTAVSGAPGAADGRVALLQSALVCELPRFLVDDVLENSTLANIKDPAAAKVHAVELVKLLTDDPGYGMKFQMVLEELPAWKKYKSQDHSLFITGPEQKSDYFLTDGSNGEPTKLLTQE